MAGKQKAKKKDASTRQPLDTRSKMYLVLGLCSVMLLVTVIVSLLLVGAFSGSADSESDSAVESESMVTESGYDKEQNTIDTAAYSSTILEESSDAGQEYVDETLFLGDSNTARMYRMFDYCTYDNAIGSVGMSARSLATFACVKFSGYSGYVTMPEAVKLMQPRRVILTFGTNDLSPSYSAEKFIENYQKGIEAVQEAYPSVDIIVNAIPPLGKSHSNQSLTQSQVDEYNKALVEMCEEKGWKFLNSAEVLKDSSTGYAKSGYVETSDGIHLTSTAMDALFEYIRTHSYITEDDRPTLTSIPEHTGDKDAVTYSTPVVSTATPAPTAEPESESESATATEAPTSTHTHSYQLTSDTATCGADGIKTYTCSCGDSYTETSPATGNHSWVEQSRTEAQPGVAGNIHYVCSVCGATKDEAIAALPVESSSSETTTTDNTISDSTASQSDTEPTG